MTHRGPLQPQPFCDSVTVLPHAVTAVKEENQLAQMPALVGSAQDLTRMTAVTLSAEQEVGPETAATASVCSLLPLQRNLKRITPS